MAQYPQGIFQSLQYLLKKVKILALAKQPVYTIGTIATTYTMPGRGAYLGQSGGGSLQFPNPALCQGQMITLLPSSGSGNFGILPTYAPTVSGSVISATSLGATYIFVSDGTKWQGGALV